MAKGYSKLPLKLRVGERYKVRLVCWHKPEDGVPVKARCLADCGRWYLMQAASGYKFTLNKFGDEVTITNG